MFIISKQFNFSASHQLAGLPEDHPCSRLHGHNYVVEIELRGTLTAVGFVRDYRELDAVKQFLDGRFDHRHLNDALPGINPTAENIALFLFNRFSAEYPELAAVRVSETPKTWAEYRVGEAKTATDPYGDGEEMMEADT